MMDRTTEERWHAALQEKGAARMLAELELTRGHPADPVFDIGDRPPCPTRAYCAQWCRNGGRPAPKGAGTAVMGGMLILVLFASIVRTIDSWPIAAPHPGYGYGQTALPLGGGTASDDGLTDPSVVSTADPHTILPSCTWVSAAGDAATVHRAPSCARLGAGSDEHAATHG
jgi:hypothetical protein